MCSLIICVSKGDDLLADWTKANLFELNNVNEARNNSILAHGHSVMHCPHDCPQPIAK